MCLWGEDSNHITYKNAKYSAQMSDLSDTEIEKKIQLKNSKECVQRTPPPTEITKIAVFTNPKSYNSRSTLTDMLKIECDH